MKKKTLLIVCLALICVIIGASVLYNNLQDRVEMPGLAAVQTTALTPATSWAPISVTATASSSSRTSPPPASPSR